MCVHGRVLMVLVKHKKLTEADIMMAAEEVKKNELAFINEIASILGTEVIDKESFLERKEAQKSVDVNELIH